MQAGYIAIHRAIQENKFYFSERFTKTGAWIDLLLLARHKPGVIFLKGIKIELNRGDVAYSMISLADRWQWDRKTVKQYLMMLEAEGMIKVKHSRTTTTIISIVKYNLYQRPEGICKNTDIGIDARTDNGNIDGTLTNIDENKQAPETTDIGIDISMDNGTDNGTDMNKNDKKDKTKTAKVPKISKDESNDSTDNKSLKIEAVPAATVGTRELLSYFAHCHEKQTGAPYMINYGKEGAAFKAMLPVYGPDRLKDIIDAFFQTKDEFVLKAGFTVGVMRSQINKLAASLAPPRAQKTIGPTAAQLYHLSKKKEEAAA